MDQYATTCTRVPWSLDSDHPCGPPNSQLCSMISSLFSLSRSMHCASASLVSSLPQNEVDRIPCSCCSICIFLLTADALPVALNPSHHYDSPSATSLEPPTRKQVERTFVSNSCIRSSSSTPMNANYRNLSAHSRRTTQEDQPDE